VEEKRLGDSRGYADYLNFNMKVIMMDFPEKKCPVTAWYGRQYPVRPFFVFVVIGGCADGQKTSL